MRMRSWGRLAPGRRYVHEDLDSPERMTNDPGRGRLHNLSTDLAQYIRPTQSAAPLEIRCEGWVGGADSKTGSNPAEPKIIQLFASVQPSDRAHVRSQVRQPEVRD